MEAAEPTKMMAVRNKHGQGMIEALFAMPLIFFAFWALLYLCYWGFLYSFITYQLEEALLCAVVPQNISRCQNELQQKIRQMTIFKEEVQVHISSQGTGLKGRVFVHLFKNNLHIEQILSLPLEKNL